MRIAAAGVCGSDITALRGQHPFRIPPLISGHEGGGEIVEIGADVVDYRVGDRVAIEPQLACGHCALCAKGSYHLCGEKIMLGVAQWPGTFAEYVRVPTSTLHRVSADVPAELTALAEPLAVAVHSVRRAGEIGGLDVAVLGGGSIGAFVVQQAVHRGAQVVATDPRAHNRQLCTGFGAAAVFDPLLEDAEQLMRSLTRTGGFDVVYVAASAPGIVDQAMRLLEPEGIAVQIGLFGHPIEFDISALQIHERRLLGSNVYTGHDFEQAIAAIEADPVRIAQVVNARGGLLQGTEYLNAKAAGDDDDIVKFLIDPSA